MTNSPAALKTSSGAKHFVALDSLRGLAALSVVLYHVPWAVPIDCRFITNSYLMVDFFFVLSGFVVCCAYHNKLGSGSQRARFLWLRFWRLYPLHLLFLLVFLGIEIFKAISQSRFGLESTAFTTNSASAFVANIFLLQATHLFSVVTFDAPSWSISTEFYTYAVFLAVASIFRSRSAFLVAAAAITAGSLSVLLHLGPHAGKTTVDYGMFRCAAGFFLGAIIFYVRGFAPQFLHRARAVDSLAAGAVLGTVIFLSLKSPGYSDLAIYPFAAAIILFLSMSPGGICASALQNRFLVWLGTLSYAVYMTHACVLWGMTQVLRAAFHIRQVRVPSHDLPIFPTTPLVGTVALAASLFLTIAVAYLVHIRIEDPVRVWSRKAWPDHAAAPYTASLIGGLAK